MTTDVSEWSLGFKLHFALGMDAFVMVRVIEGDAHCPPHGEPVVFQVRRLPGGCVEDGRRAAVVRRAAGSGRVARRTRSRLGACGRRAVGTGIERDRSW